MWCMSVEIAKSSGAFIAGTLGGCARRLGGVTALQDAGCRMQIVHKIDSKIDYALFISVSRRIVREKVYY